MRNTRRTVVRGRSFSLIRQLHEVSAQASPGSSGMCLFSNVLVYNYYNYHVAHGAGHCGSGRCRCCCYPAKGGGNYASSIVMGRSSLVRYIRSDLGNRVRGITSLSTLLSDVDRRHVGQRLTRRCTTRVEMGRGHITRARNFGTGLCRGLIDKVLAGRRFLSCGQGCGTSVRLLRGTVTR